jgi:hypothetical protein
MGRSVDIRLKEHRRHISLQHPDKSAVAEHSMDQGHRIQFNNFSILATSPRDMDDIVREAMEVVLLHFNMNKGDGFCLSRLWECFICSLKLPGREPESTHLRGPCTIPRPLVVCSLNFPPPKPLYIDLYHCGNLPHR